ncbi:hypothetical protein [Streptomyces sp. NPDC048603]|uniref:hypothetical protein n=1 Tax=Streptomyces sp. NPDC048603 TaxID=3365577 RepID=UPI0037174648
MTFTPRLGGGRHGMGIKAMRRTRDAILRGLELPTPVDAAGVFSALCASMARRHRQPVDYRLVRFPVSTVSGLLVRTEHRNLILIEENTSTEHQLGILGHELWHLEQDPRPSAGPPARFDTRDTRDAWDARDPWETPDTRLDTRLDNRLNNRRDNRRQDRLDDRWDAHPGARPHARPDCSRNTEAEADCEIFGSLVAGHCMRWLDTGAHSLPQSSSQFERRLHTSLGRPGPESAW